MRRHHPFRQTKYSFTFIVVGFLGLSLLLLSLSLFLFSVFLSPVNQQDKTSQVFVVQKGESAASIVKRLHKSGLIRSPLGFRLLLRKDRLATRLQAGTYHLSPSSSSRALALTLTKGFSDLRLTIPEGFRLEQIAALVEADFSLSAADFLAAAAGQEGYLFPDTYFFSPVSDLSTIIQTMRTNYDKQLAGLDPTKEDLILASLVERETKGDAEKPLVAGILKKRLANGWPLQVDATIQYLIGNKKEWWPHTTLLDREKPSPFNTYLHSGLPPSPISNPGLASIKAVLEPTDSPYWFYLHDREGVIHYAATSSDHADNIVKYLR